MRRQVDGVKYTREKGAADPALLDLGPERTVGRSVAQVVVRPHHDAGGFTDLDHAPCVGEIQRERLLAKDMLASRGRRERLRAMEFVGGRDIDGVDTTPEERIKARHRCRDAVLRSETV